MSINELEKFRECLMKIVKDGISKKMMEYVGSANDAWTRAQVVGAIDTYIKDIMIISGTKCPFIDFDVQCNEINNDNYVIDTNRLVVDLYQKEVFGNIKHYNFVLDIGYDN